MSECLAFVPLNTLTTHYWLVSASDSNRADCLTLLKRKRRKLDSSAASLILIFLSVQLECMKLFVFEDWKMFAIGQDVLMKIRNKRSHKDKRTVKETSVPFHCLFHSHPFSLSLSILALHPHFTHETMCCQSVPGCETLAPCNIQQD